MALPAVNPDRRRTPRTKLTGLAYINFEPNNGGIVLNISEGGLCFHLVAPVHRSVALPFSLSANGIRIEAHAVLAWTDEHRKTGGLRFNGLDPDARRQIRTLIDQSSRPFGREGDLAVPAPSSEELSERLPNGVPAVVSVVNSALPQWVRAPLRWGDFSRGLAAGLLIALLLASGFSLDTRRRQIGSFLIRIGEHLEVAPQQPVAAPSIAGTPTPPAPGPPAAGSVRGSISSLVTVPAASPSTWSASARPAENLALRPATGARPRLRSSLESTTAAPAIASPLAGSLPSSATPASAPLPPAATNPSQPVSGATQPTSPASASPTAPSNRSSVVAKAADQPGENENSEDVVEINSGVPLGRYFEVGKFKDEFAAERTEHNLTDLRFHATVLPKSLLWLKSYQVLIGPYREAEDADAARRSLQSQGYKPRALPERSRQLTLAGSGMDLFNVFSAEKDSDNLIVTWEAYGAQATVRFVKKGETTGTAVGKWVKLPDRSSYSAIVYTTGDPGKRTLLSIQFSGMKQAVMLPRSADRGIVF